MVQQNKWREYLDRHKGGREQKQTKKTQKQKTKDRKRKENMGRSNHLLVTRLNSMVVVNKKKRVAQK